MVENRHGMILSIQMIRRTYIISKGDGGGCGRGKSGPISQRPPGNFRFFLAGSTFLVQVHTFYYHNFLLKLQFSTLNFSAANNVFGFCLNCVSHHIGFMFRRSNADFRIRDTYLFSSLVLSFHISSPSCICCIFLDQYEILLPFILRAFS